MSFVNFEFVIAQVSISIAIFLSLLLCLKGRRLYTLVSSYKIFKAKTTVTMFFLLVVLEIEVLILCGVVLCFGSSHSQKL